MPDTQISPYRLGPQHTLYVGNFDGRIPLVGGARPFELGAVPRIPLGSALRQSGLAVIIQSKPRTQGLDYAAVFDPLEQNLRALVLGMPNQPNEYLVLTPQTPSLPERGGAPTSVGAGVSAPTLQHCTLTGRRWETSPTSHDIYTDPAWQRYFTLVNDQREFVLSIPHLSLPTDGSFLQIYMRPILEYSRLLSQLVLARDPYLTLELCFALPQGDLLETSCYRGRLKTGTRRRFFSFPSLETRSIREEILRGVAAAGEKPFAELSQSEKEAFLLVKGLLKVLEKISNCDELDFIWQSRRIADQAKLTYLVLLARLRKRGYKQYISETALPQVMDSVSDAEFALFIHPHKNRYFAQASLGAAPGVVDYRVDHTALDFINALPPDVYERHILPKLIAAAKLGISDDGKTVCIFLYEAIQELDDAKKLTLLEKLYTDQIETGTLILTQTMLHSSAQSRKYIFENNPLFSAIFIVWALVGSRWDPAELAAVTRQAREAILTLIEEPSMVARIRRGFHSVH